MSEFVADAVLESEAARACARALVLVNWKGVFYERYLLDHRVTALEGANGAGKTTVMVAAYLVLLPDLTRLRFTNVGETGASGGDRGIWGRLGEEGRPSYAAMAVEVPGTGQIVMGVHIEKKTEPAVGVVPFLISGVGEEVRLQDLFLLSEGEHEEIPTLEQVAELCREAGAELSICKSAKEYFARLFELGVSPLRLSGEEERAKFNDMLRTSMTGGISRALTSELRNFVLKQDLGLTTALGRMRASLQTCRRTRIEVSESRGLEHEVSGIFEAGNAAFCAAASSIRLRAKEVAAALRQAEAQLEAAREREILLATRTKELSQEHAELSLRLESLQSERTEVLNRLLSARQRRDGSLRLAEVQTELADACAEFQAAKHALETAASARQVAHAKRDESQKAAVRCAEGLADLQQGLDELHQLAHGYTRARKVVSQVRQVLGTHLPELVGQGDFLQRLVDVERGQAKDASPEGLQASIQLRLAEIDSARVALARAIGLSAQRDKETSLARNALEALEEGLKLAGVEELRAVDATDSEYDRAKLVLAVAREAHSRTSERASLASRIQRLTEQLTRRRQLLTVLEDTVAEHPDVLEGIEVSRLSEAEFRRCLRRCEDQLRSFQEQVQGVRYAVTGGRQKCAELSAVIEREVERKRAWDYLAERARDIASATTDDSKDEREAPSPSEQWLEETKTAVAASASRARQQLASAEQKAESLALERAELEGTRGSLSSAYSDLCEELEGEPLATRYNDFKLEHAREMHARLGPLTSAIVVENVEASLAKLRRVGQTVDSLWLLQAGKGLPPGVEDAALVRPEEEDELTAAAELEGDACAEEFDHGEPTDGHVQQDFVEVDYGFATLRARIPQHTFLGLAARQKRLQAVLASLKRHRGKAESLMEQVAHWVSVELALSELTSQARLWLQGDPAEALRERRGQQRDAERTMVLAIESLAAAEAQAESLQAAVLALRRAQPDAQLLQLADAGTELARLQAECSRTEAISAVVERLSSEVGQLRTNLDGLTPREEASPGVAVGAQCEELEAERDRLFQLSEALDELAKSWGALQWESAPDRLRERDALAPALKTQHQRAVELAKLTQEQLDASEEDWASAVASHHTAQSVVTDLRAREASLTAELSRSDTEEPEALEFREAQLSRGHSDLMLELQKLSAEAARQEQLHEQLTQGLNGYQAKLDELKLQAQPADAAWRELLDASGQGQLSLPHGAEAEAEELHGSLALGGRARSKSAILCERLQSAKGGAELAQEIGARLAADDSAAPESTQPERAQVWVSIWLEVRAWLAQRVPARIAQSGEPLTALGHLREELKRLEGRLHRQEQELRGSSQDVAHNIEVQIRKASGQIRRLNQNLEGISFGGIAAIRVRMSRVERTEPVLNALRDGSAQSLLFQSNLPFEDALEEIFRRFGGGRGGGQRLLDYRQYIELSVEIRRQAGSKWESANPSRLSTGEAIGVGAALMMVILSEWERDSNLLRAKRSNGSLRFLFLDEANRLSQDNLGVLFELCGALELQLMIAAPEVAHLDNNTTYRLVRKLSAEGREEVVVSGRRARPAPRGIDEEPVEPPLQGSLEI